MSGPATVIEAVASGRRAAEAIFMFITGADLDGALPPVPESDGRTRMENDPRGIGRSDRC